jgi:hypothetical protein
MKLRALTVVGAIMIALAASACTKEIVHDDALDEAQRIKAAAIRRLGGVPSARGIPERLIISALDGEWARVDSYPLYKALPQHMLVLRRSERGWRVVWHGRAGRRDRPKLEESLKRLGAPEDLGRVSRESREEDLNLRSAWRIDSHRRCGGFSFEAWSNDSCRASTGSGFLLVGPIRSYIIEVEPLSRTSRPLDELAIAELSSRAAETMGAFSGVRPRVDFSWYSSAEWMTAEWRTSDSLRVEWWVERRDGQPPYHFIAQSAANPRLHPKSALHLLMESIRKL